MNSKISEFYGKVMADENLKAKLEKILDGKDITEATDDQLKQIGDIAKELGYNFTLEDVKDFTKSGDVQLSDDALDAVAGGVNKGTVKCKGDESGTQDDNNASK